MQLIDQYTRTVEQADPETASAFIEMAAHLVEMKSYLLLPRSEEGERMKQEFTGQLIEYDQCRRMAALLRAKGGRHPRSCGVPWRWSWDNTYALHHAPQILGRLLERPCRAHRLRRPTQQQFEPLVTAPMVSVTSRVVYILRSLISRGAPWQKWPAVLAQPEPQHQRGHLSGPAGAGARRPRHPGGERGADHAAHPDKGEKMNQKQIRAAVEAMLFACGEPIGSDKLAQAVQLPQTSVENALEELRTRYTREDSGLCLLHLNTRWQLATKTEWADCVRRVLDSRRAVPLGPAAMETLTVIAYNQPVSRAFIEQVRGVDSSSSVSGLLEKGLIEEAGRLDLPGRPVSFRTTDTFLRVFGLSSLADLPPVHQPEAPAESEE